MDSSRFDALTRSLAAATTRRGVLAGFGLLVFGVRRGAAQPDCLPGQSRNRKGECSCPAGTDACPDGCFNLRRDLLNCGECGQTCIGGECRKGECRCPSGLVLCNGVCRTLESFLDDPENCGSCGFSCDDGNACTVDTCAGGICQYANLSCDDNDACTHDFCDTSLGCQHQQITCDDDNPCTDNSCNAATGCVYTTLTGIPCSTGSGAAGTCSVGTCVANTTTTTTTRAPLQCEESSDCGEDHVCVNGTCYQHCFSNNDCEGCACDCHRLLGIWDTRGGGYCLNGLDFVGECKEQSDCPAGSACSDYVNDQPWPDTKNLCARPCCS
jgi:hypothetical protein